MKCKECGGKGWVETWHAGSATWTPSLSQCRKRCNITGYSDEVQKRLNNPDHVTQSPVLVNRQALHPSRSGNVISLRRPTMEQN